MHVVITLFPHSGHFTHRAALTEHLEQMYMFTEKRCKCKDPSGNLKNRCWIIQIQRFFLSSPIQQLQHWLIPPLLLHKFISLPLSLTLFLSSHPPLLCLCACGCAAARAATVYLSELPISAYCQWKPRKLITKLIMVPGVEYMLCACLAMGAGLCHSPPPSPHVMPVTWFPGKQLSKSESDFYF